MRFGAKLSLLLVLACDEPAALLPETDHRALTPVELDDLQVDTQGVLWRRAGGISTKLLDGVAGSPAILADRSIVVSRRGDAPGETDLWLVPASGEPRALAPAAGPDELPTLLADGRVAFVSARTTVASIWVVDPRTGVATQLTNKGLAAGKNLSGFVPTPMMRMTAAANELRYESAPGVHWAVDATTGTARRVEVQP
jgi:hypothetical protein